MAATALGNPDSAPQFRPEKLAAEALATVLQHSRVAAVAFREFIGQTGFRLPSGELGIRFQGEDAERPELVALDAKGREVIAIHAEFWDRFPAHQPAEVLKRFPRVGDGGVLVIAPPGRFDSLWELLLARARKVDRDAHETGRSGHWRAARLDGGRMVLLASWPAMLRAMSASAMRASSKGTLLALVQLQQLCSREDEQAFLPLQPGESMSRESRRVRDFSRLAAALLQRSASEGFCSLEGEGPSPGPGAVEHRLRIHGVEAGLCVSADWAAKYFDTPLWLSLQAAGNGDLRAALQDLEQDSPPRLIADGSRLLVPLLPLVAAEKDAVVQDLASQLRELAARFERVRAPSR
ncbi:MAG TPA: hypothetical protein VK447_05700 [Myxococcaceae bacterium]|nr:hypothetical protein [Myxococcaceae bacterium]